VLLLAVIRGILLILQNNANFLLFCQNTPEYPYLQERASNGLPGHDLLFHEPKYVPKGNQLMFWGSDSGCLLAYSWQSGLLLSTFLKPLNRGVLRAFPGGGLGKRGPIRGWMGGNKDTVVLVKKRGVPRFKPLVGLWNLLHSFTTTAGQKLKNSLLYLFCFEAWEGDGLFR